jgi:HSP90 family molecular chaperone
VIVRQGGDSDEYWIEVEDNGVGMSADVLRGPFLDFGISLWDSELMYKEFPGLSAKGFQSTGKYGIGFFSVFMWGKRVRVTTRRYDAAQQETHVLDFGSGVDSRPLLRKAQDEEVLRDGGTRVRVWLKELSDALYVAHSGTSWELQDVCAWLCPSIDVDLYVEIEGEERKKVISASDWISMDGEDLLKRIDISVPVMLLVVLLRSEVFVHAVFRECQVFWSARPRRLPEMRLNRLWDMMN